MMKVILVVVVVIVAAIVGAGFVLPTKYEVERSVVIKADGETVFPYLNNLRKWQDWSAWTPEKYPTMKTTYDGPEEGVGAISKWIDENGAGSMVITQSDPKSGIAYNLEFEGFDPSQGVIEFETTPEGTKVTMRNHGELRAKFYHRYFGLFMDKMMGSEFEEGLTKLKTIVESGKAS